jgi:DNA repair protein RadC
MHELPQVTPTEVVAVMAAPLLASALPGVPTAPNRLRELAAGERPQERAFAHGVSSLSDTELLALLLRSGTKGQDVITLATRLLAEAGSLHALARWHEADFRRLKGIGRIKALQICTVMELARRVLSSEREGAVVLANAADIYAFLRPRTLGLDREKLWVTTLNARNHLIRCVELTIGTTTQTLFRSADILREVIRDGASAFAVAHNHPSGDPSPSVADLRLTRELTGAAHAVNLKLIDHLILGDPDRDGVGLGYYSFRRAAFIPD